MVNVVIGNAPIDGFTGDQLGVIRRADRVIIFNDARSLRHLPTDIRLTLCFANSYLHRDRILKEPRRWKYALRSASEIWCTYQNADGRLLGELCARFARDAKVTKVFPIEPHNPSSGHQVLRHLTEDLFNTIYIAGFAFEGWEHHPWESEKRWTIEQIKNRRIQPL